MTFDREQIIEQAARVQVAATNRPGCDGDVWDEISSESRIHWMHRPVNTRVYTERDCRDRMCEDHDDLLSGANYCPSYLIQTCAECHLYVDEDEDDATHPCPTVRLCDEIDAQSGVQR
ncbi:MAG: hypothetical protein QM628_00400 [Propionicimonas sp.]